MVPVQTVLTLQFINECIKKYLTLDTMLYNLLTFMLSTIRYGMMRHYIIHILLHNEVKVEVSLSFTVS